MYSWMAASISQPLGEGPLANNENVRWYVGEYRRERVVRFANASATSGESVCDRCSTVADDVDRRYDITACSSAKVERSCVAMYVASADDEEVGDGTELGG